MYSGHCFVVCVQMLRLLYVTRDTNVTMNAARRLYLHIQVGSHSVYNSILLVLYARPRTIALYYLHPIKLLPYIRNVEHFPT